MVDTIVDSNTIDSNEIIINSSITNLNGHTRMPPDNKIEKAILKITKAIDSDKVNLDSVLFFFCSVESFA